MNVERWVTDLKIGDFVFLVYVTGYLNNLNKKLQGKLITEIHNIKALKAKIRP